MYQIYTSLFLLFAGIIPHTSSETDKTTSIVQTITEILNNFSIAYQSFSVGPLKLPNPYHHSVNFGPNTLAMYVTIHNPKINQQPILKWPQFNDTFCHFPDKYLKIDIPENDQNITLQSELTLAGNTVTINDLGFHNLRITDARFYTEEPPAPNKTILQMEFQNLIESFSNVKVYDRTVYHFTLPWIKSVKPALKEMILNRYFHWQIETHDPYRKLRSLCLQYKNHYADALYVIRQDPKFNIGSQKYVISIKGLTDFDQLYIFWKRNTDCTILKEISHSIKHFDTTGSFMKCAVLFTRPLQGNVEWHYKDEKGKTEQKIFQFTCQALRIDHIIDKQSQKWNLIKLDPSLESLKIQHFVQQTFFNVSQQILVSELTDTIITSLQSSLTAQFKASLFNV